MRSFLQNTLFFWKIFWDGSWNFLKTARVSVLSSSVWKPGKHKFSPPAMGSENLGRGGVVALVSMMQQSSCTTLCQGRGKWLQTWMSSAAGFLLFSKCFWRCCSWTFSASPDPKMPWKDRVMQDFRHFLLRKKGINEERMQVCGRRWLHGIFVPFLLLHSCDRRLSWPFKDHRPHQVVLNRLLELPFQAGGVQVLCYSPFPLKLCLHDTKAMLNHPLDLGVQDLSSSVKFFPSLDLEKIISYNLALGQFPLLFSPAQSDFVSFLYEDVADKGNKVLGKMGQILIVTVVDPKSFENMSWGVLC